MEDCIYCGNSIPKGTGHEVLDENFNSTHSYECEGCWQMSIEIDSEYEQRCKKCQEVKPLVEFNETSLGAKIKRITTCKSCQSIYNAADYQKRKNMKRNLESINDHIMDLEWYRLKNN